MNRLRVPVLRIRIRDWVPFWPLDPGSGMGESQHPDPGWTTRIIFFRALETIVLLFCGLKYLNSLMRIRDPGWKKVGSGINIPDPPHWRVLSLALAYEYSPNSPIAPDSRPNKNNLEIQIRHLRPEWLGWSTYRKKISSKKDLLPPSLCVCTAKCFSWLKKSAR